MLTRMPKVGETIRIEPSGCEYEVLDVDENIVTYDHFLEEHEEWNCLIARFDTNSEGNITWNENVTIVGEEP